MPKGLKQVELCKDKNQKDFPTMCPTLQIGKC